MEKNQWCNQAVGQKRRTSRFSSRRSPELNPQRARSPKLASTTVIGTVIEKKILFPDVDFKPIIPWFGKPMKSLYYARLLFRLSMPSARKGSRSEPKGKTKMIRAGT
jgi:hypothetical protein